MTAVLDLIMAKIVDCSDDELIGVLRVPHDPTMVAAYVHEGQTDKQGVDYFSGHVMSVAKNVADREAPEITHAAAWLHDTIEDTPLTYLDLIDLGFPLEVVEIVDAVTRREGETYSDFISRVAMSGHAARQVKLGDLAHNLDPTRGPIPDSLFARYMAAQKSLVEANARWMARITS